MSQNRNPRIQQVSGIPIMAYYYKQGSVEIRHCIVWSGMHHYQSKVRAQWTIECGSFAYQNDEISTEYGEVIEVNWRFWWIDY